MILAIIIAVPQQRSCEDVCVSGAAQNKQQMGSLEWKGLHLLNQTETTHSKFRMLALVARVVEAADAAAAAVAGTEQCLVLPRFCNMCAT